LRFGLYLPNFGAFGDAQRLAELALRAERAGWDGFFIWDHVARPGSPELVDPWVALAAIAVATERIRIGALVTPLARRRPAQVARAAVSLDRLSGGRLVFGAGLGSGRAEEWEQLGELSDARIRAARLDESLDLLAALWSGRPVDHDGPHFRVHTDGFLPVPQQTPRIPVWIGGYWPNRAPFRRAARWDGAFPLFDPAEGDVLSQLADCIDFIHSERGRSDLDVIHLSEPDSTKAAHEHAAQLGTTWWLDRMSPDAFEAATTHIDAGPGSTS
jgi:alkanesulfonate monooxygenase SsuD/methylene tetrahydromethanopterin reductase-like flavin-dependent oxidoreductase (luciferase family)